MENDRQPLIFTDPETTVFGAFDNAAGQCAALPALSFMGKTVTYGRLKRETEDIARALLAAGVRENDAVTFMMPNCPQAVAVYYAVSRIGAVSNMIHTLSSVEEIAFYLNKTNSRLIVTTDLFADRALKGADAAGTDAAVAVTPLSEFMPPILKLGYAFKTRKNKTKSGDNKRLLPLRSLKKRGAALELPPVVYREDRVASILYSGGSTGLPKGICLSDKNINALGKQIAEAAGHRVEPGLKFLSAMPMFHGFGLGVGLHALLCNGAQCVLLPQFDLGSCIKTVLKEKTNMMAVVPSMLEALLRSDAFDGRDLSFLKGIYCGADTVSPQLEERANAFLKDHGCREQVRPGYGLTECVTVCTLNPIDKVKPGSIGVPIGEMKCRVVRPGTFEDVPAGEPGELLVAGPTVMLRYLDEPEETAKTVRADADGVRWLFTGDLCKIDGEGYVYFIQRLKRLIITSGYNVYPAQVERVIQQCPCVKECCVVGVKNRLLGQSVAAAVVLQKDVLPEAARKEIAEACKKGLAQYAAPSLIVFRDALPLTKLGKVDCVRIEAELNEKGGKP